MTRKILTEMYLHEESSFYQIVSAIGAIGVSLEEGAVVDTFADIISKKKELTSKTGDWPQYVQLASWLTYLGSLIDVRGTSLEEIYLDSVTFSMETMSKGLALGYSWNAYKVWDARWSSLTGIFWERRKWPDLHYIDDVELHIIETHSLQSPSSFNMLGEFDFSDEKLQDTIGVLAKSRPNSSLKIGRHQIDNPKFSSWGKIVLWQVIDVEPITVFGMFENG